jgi:hypothetical protein
MRYQSFLQQVFRLLLGVSLLLGCRLATPTLETTETATSMSLGIAPTPKPQPTLAPIVMEVPAGASDIEGVINIPVTSPDDYQDGRGEDRWFVDELPPGVTYRFSSQAAPFQTVLYLNTSEITPEGHHTLQFRAHFSNTVWTTPIELTVLPCHEFEPSLFTQSMTDLTTIYWGRDTRDVLMVPIPICNEPKTLKISIESAISEAKTPLTTPPVINLYRSLIWPIPRESISMTVMDDITYEKQVWQLEQRVMPGIYLFAIEHSNYDPEHKPTPDEIPYSVTYRVEIEPDR